MRRSRNFVALSRSERRLLARALVTVCSIRLGLWLLPFRILRPLLERRQAAPTVTAGGEAAHRANRIAWAVSTAARYVPRATCLTQALAAQRLLARCGEGSDLHIGVARGERRAVTAHAWLAARGTVVIGGESLERYIPLTSLAKRQA